MSFTIYYCVAGVKFVFKTFTVMCTRKNSVFRMSNMNIRHTKFYMFLLYMYVIEII